MTSAVASSMSTIPMSEFAKIGFMVGTIKRVQIFPEARKPSYQVTISYGPGFEDRVSAAQLPSNYPKMERLVRKQVLTVTNFPPMKIAGFSSQILIVGFPDKEGHVHLLNTRDATFPDSSKLTFGWKGKKLNKIKYDDFTAAEIRSATIVGIKQISKIEEEVKANAEKPVLVDFEATIDVGKFGKIQTLLPDLIPETAAKLLNTQVAALINLEKEGDKTNAIVLSARTEKGEHLPFGVDKPVENGGKLF